MKKTLFFSLFITCCLSITHAENTAQAEFKQIFAHQNILHAYREKNEYQLICTEYVEQGKNRPAPFYYDADKNSISFIYMERNTYQIQSIKKQKHDFIVTLDNGALKFKVHQISANIYAWDAFPKADDVDTMYTLFYKNSWQELKTQHVVNACQDHGT
ncbi:hypothetical protein [Acinetobacter sp. CFCC 10889]|uniref:hypothetical protein n=1 Tax=Acinetobacter sp. CFCC 10889 TaxID=1775557 RepID=UPI000DCFEC5C|nr:hypothetical protein [Acinetobacter sp. CFCC 10889]